jgi:hypothetical protein
MTGDAKKNSHEISEKTAVRRRRVEGRGTSITHARNRLDTTIKRHDTGRKKKRKGVREKHAVISCT